MNDSNRRGGGSRIHLEAQGAGPKS